jgi:hypothetical protein
MSDPFRAPPALPAAFLRETPPLRKGQSAKVNETFSENLTNSGISPLKFFTRAAGINLFHRLMFKPATDCTNPI